MILKDCNADANDLGRMHLSGLGCEKDEDAAQEWFAKAYQAFLAEEGRAKKPGYMQYRIGKLFSFGYGVEQDYLQAAAWYEKAVANEKSLCGICACEPLPQGPGGGTGQRGSLSTVHHGGL